MLYTYIHSYPQTGYIHKITDSGTGHSLYPDVIYAHPYPELEVTDSELFDLAEQAMRENGKSSCVFMASVPDDYDNVRAFLDQLSASVVTGPSTVLTGEDYQLTEGMAVSLQLSDTMRRQFFQLAEYYVETEGNLADLFTPFLTEYALPVKTKNQGKELYERIRNVILG